MSIQENCEVIRVSVEQAAGRVPIMAGCGSNCTAEAIELAGFAKKVGANCQLQVVPYYNKPTQEGQYQHFKAIAEAVDLPMVLYNVPGRSMADMALETALRLAQVPGVIGIKEATGNIDRAQWLIREAPEGFAIYSGDDPTAVALMLCGGQRRTAPDARAVHGGHCWRREARHGNPVQTHAIAQKPVCRGQPDSREMGGQPHGPVRPNVAPAHDRTHFCQPTRGRSCPACGGLAVSAANLFSLKDLL